MKTHEIFDYLYPVSPPPNPAPLITTNLIAPLITTKLISFYMTFLRNN